MNKGTLYSKEKFKNYFSDVAGGARLVAGISPRLTAIVLCSYIIQAVLPLVSLLILKKCLDSLIPVEQIDQSEVLIYFALFILSNVAAVIVTQYSVYIQSLHQHAVSKYFARHVLDKAVRFDVEEYENPKFYNELHLVHQQTIYKPAAFLTVYQGVIQSIITILLLSGFLLTVHWLFPILLVLISIPLAINKILYGYHQYLQDKTNIPLERKSADLYSYLTTEPYAKEVRIFNYGKGFIDMFLSLRERIFQQRRKLTSRFIKRTILIQTLEAIVVAGAYYFLIKGTLAGAITVGGLVIYIQMFQRFQQSINSLFQSGIGLFQHHLYMRNVLRYMKRPIRDNKPMPPTPGIWKGIELCDLSFAYPNTSKQVLRKINLNIPSGSFVAIVGENGSGKSTLMKIISRLYDPSEGSILLNGTNAKEFDKDDWWKKSSMLLQDYGKYYLSIESNITLSEKDIETGKLKYAASVSGVDSFVGKLTDGYNTYLGRNYKNGVQLSGGQWQKLAIARSVYKKSNMLILDEPTSSLDPISEYNLIKEIKNSIENKIVILITHKLYNLKMVDKIYVVKGGMIVEEGSFNELIEKKGEFFNSYQKQFA